MRLLLVELLGIANKMWYRIMCIYVYMCIDRRMAWGPD